MSDLSTYHPDVPANWQLKNEMASDTLRQVEKDFALHGEEITFSYSNLDSYHDLMRALAEELERKQFLESSKLVAVLYQIDLKESDLANEMKQVKPLLVYSYLADIILKRCFQKVYWRYKMSENK